MEVGSTCNMHRPSQVTRIHQIGQNAEYLDKRFICYAGLDLNIFIKLSLTKSNFHFLTIVSRIRIVCRNLIIHGAVSSNWVSPLPSRWPERKIWIYLTTNRLLLGLRGSETGYNCGLYDRSVWNYHLTIGTRHANSELHRSDGTLCRNHDDDDENVAVEGENVSTKYI